MYNLNTKQGKEERIKRLEILIAKVSKREKMDLDEEREIINYLYDIKQDLKGQLFMEVECTKTGNVKTVDLL